MQFSTHRKGMLDIAKNTAKIDPSSLPILMAVAKIMKENPTIKIRVEGHTDNIGKPKKNLALSKKRAAVVRAFLIKKPTKKNPLAGGNIAAKKLKSQGYGDKKPMASNEAEEGKAKNRRVVFTILP